MKQQRYKTMIVTTMPNQLNEGILYISIEYNTAMHRCACGCGSEIVTPISRLHGWILTYDGENASLHPSIGNGAYQCKSHYWLNDGIVRWAAPIGISNQKNIPKKEKKMEWWEKLRKIFM